MHIVRPLTFVAFIPSFIFGLRMGLVFSDKGN